MFIADCAGLLTGEGTEVGASNKPMRSLKFDFLLLLSDTGFGLFRVMCCGKPLLKADGIESCTEDGRCGDTKPSPNAAELDEGFFAWKSDGVSLKESKKEKLEEEGFVDAGWRMDRCA